MEYVSPRDQGNSLTRSQRRRPEVLTSFNKFVLTIGAYYTNLYFRLEATQSYIRMIRCEPLCTDKLYADCTKSGTTAPKCCQGNYFGLFTVVCQAPSQEGIGRQL